MAAILGPHGLTDAAPAPEPPCDWREDDWSAWKGDCGILWVFNDGTPKENGMAYCPRCGKRLREVR